MNIESQVLSLIDATAATLGLEVVLKRYHPSRKIECIIDRTTQGVTISDCMEMNRAILAAIEAHGLDPGSFHVEVMSPGVNRPLVQNKDFTRFAGQIVRITLKKKQDGQRNFSGQLKGLEGDRVVILVEPNQAEQSFPRQAIKTVRLG
jgi:ribosome maturation factor RimP